jgi:hypothetical protein
MSFTHCGGIGEHVESPVLALNVSAGMAGAFRKTHAKRRETGKRGQVPCDEGVTTHIGPESCAVAREGLGEALTGVRRGPRKFPILGADTVGCRRTSPGPGPTGELAGPALWFHFLRKGLLFSSFWGDRRRGITFNVW